MSTPSSWTGGRLVVLVVLAVVVGGVAVESPTASAQGTDTPEPDTTTAQSNSTSTTGVTTNGISGLLIGVAAIAILWYRRRRGG